MDYKCEWCRKDDFRFDGQHMSCKNCGQVLVRELTKDKKSGRVGYDKKKFFSNLEIHYNEMNDIDDFIDYFEPLEKKTSNFR